MPTNSKCITLKVVASKPVVRKSIKTAKVTVKTASETTNAGVTKEVQKLEFLIRQSPATLNINSTNFRILFRNSIYNVTGITPLYDHNNYMKIEGEIRKAGASDDYS